MNKFKPGDRALIRVEIQTTSGSGGHVIGLGSAKHSALAFPEQLIPIPPPPLPAPNCEGMWANCEQGVSTARDVFKRNGALGYRNKAGCWVDIFHGTWHGPIDPRLFGVEEVEEEVKPVVDEHEVIREFIAGCADSVRDACDRLILRLGPTPAPPGDET